jgi:tripartite-type tricarboxylate transporter receptor subunit TctC
MKRIALATGLALLAAFAQPAGAQERYPEHPIRLIVSFPAGGPLDVMARLTAQSLSARLGQQVIVDNRPGAGGTLAGREAARAEPDGYTLLFGSSASLAIGPALYKNVGYDPLTSFAPVAMVSSVPYIMIGRRDAPYRTIAELLAYAQQNPGKLNFGVPNGAPPHMLTLQFKMLTDADVVIVPYKGASTLITDMIGGQIDGGFETTSVMLGHIADGHIRAVAVVHDTRLPQLPDVPTMKESGVDLVGSSWAGVLAPAGTPAAIVERIRAEIVAALKSDMREKLDKLGAEAVFLSPAQFAGFIADENRRIAAIIRGAGAAGE